MSPNPFHGDDSFSYWLKKKKKKKKKKNVKRYTVGMHNATAQIGLGKIHEETFH